MHRKTRTRGAVVDGAHLQVLEAAEGPFHGAQPLVGPHRAGTVELALRQADHVEELGLGGDGSRIAPIGEDPLVVDGPREMLGHPADDLPLPDLPGALETALVSPCRCGNRCEQGLGGLEQFLALPVLGQQRVAAEALAGIRIAGDLHQVPLVEERHLDIAGLHQGTDTPQGAGPQASPPRGPRSASPTSTTFARENRSCSVVICEDSVAGCCRGTPTPVPVAQKADCSLPFLPSRE